MLLLTYIDALLADESLADFVWDAWNADLLSDEEASAAWMSIASNCKLHPLQQGTRASRLH